MLASHQVLRLMPRSLPDFKQSCCYPALLPVSSASGVSPKSPGNRPSPKPLMDLSSSFPKLARPEDSISSLLSAILMSIIAMLGTCHAYKSLGCSAVSKLMHATMLGDHFSGSLGQANHEQSSVALVSLMSVQTWQERCALRYQEQCLFETYLCRAVKVRGAKLLVRVPLAQAV